MPYITQEDRTSTENELFDEALQFVPNNAGELNFLVSTLIDNYLTENGVRYRHINEMIGALECCKLELYRRIASPYEDVVMAKNGDAYTQEIETPKEDY
tara:strand:+ start:524 stop:820 length:297 start_codon:yes stop_codon:yes gene_type:complete